MWQLSTMVRMSGAAPHYYAMIYQQRFRKGLRLHSQVMVDLQTAPERLWNQASATHLKSVDWTRIHLRSFRRAGINRLRILATNKYEINYFGRWATDKKGKMQMRCDRTAIKESVNANAAM